jgi:hypothetical protein
MSSNNIFSALAKYNSARNENYLTESFVFVINTFLQREHIIGLEILNLLCAENNEFFFSTNEDVTISTQEKTKQGTPDIKVSSPDKLVYIEVKHDSPLSPSQLLRYRTALETSSALIKRVVLLTRFTIDFEKPEDKPYKNVRWFEIYNWLTNMKGRVKDLVCVYLIESFNSFLEAKGMSIQRVGNEYIDGMSALNNLINMIDSAIQNVGIPFYRSSPKGAGWNFKGFWLEDKEFWCGIHYNNASVITFELIDKNKYNTKLIEIPSDYVKLGKKRIWFRLPLEESSFFSLDKDKQLETITYFVKKAYSDAQKMRIKG